jgi:hypothetical protein
MALRNRRLAEADFRPSQGDQERILGTNDLVDVNYVARAQLASKAVCRIIVRDAQGREIGYGTGFKVAPNVLMTNEHVLENAASVATAIAEFGYELDLSGRPAPTTRFKLNPAALFFNDTSPIRSAQPPVRGERQSPAFAPTGQGAHPAGATRHSVSLVATAASAAVARARRWAGALRATLAAPLGVVGLPGGSTVVAIGTGAGSGVFHECVSLSRALSVLIRPTRLLPSHYTPPPSLSARGLQFFAALPRKWPN